MERIGKVVKLKFYKRFIRKETNNIYQNQKNIIEKNTLPLTAGYNSLLVTSLILHIAFAASKFTISLLWRNHTSKRSYICCRELKKKKILIKKNLKNKHEFKGNYKQNFLTLGLHLKF